MNYQWHYDQLIETRKLLNRNKKDGNYYENHHIIMKSMGGTNDPENLVLLTAREHFIAHWLLWRIHRNESSSRAFFCMNFYTNNGKQKNERINFSSIAYEESRIAYINTCKISISKASLKKWNEIGYKEFMKERRTGCQLNKYVSENIKERMKSARTRHCVTVILKNKTTNEILIFDKAVRACDYLHVDYGYFLNERNHENINGFEIELQRNDYIKNKRTPAPSTKYIFEKLNVKTEILGKANAVEFAKNNNINIKYVIYKNLRLQGYDNWKISTCKIS